MAPLGRLQNKGNICTTGRPPIFFWGGGGTPCIVISGVCDRGVETTRQKFNHCLTEEIFGKQDHNSLLDLSLAFSYTDCIRKRLTPFNDITYLSNRC